MTREQLEALPHVELDLLAAVAMGYEIRGEAQRGGRKHDGWRMCWESDGVVNEFGGTGSRGYVEWDYCGANDEEAWNPTRSLEDAFALAERVTMLLEGKDCSFKVKRRKDSSGSGYMGEFLLDGEFTDSEGVTRWCEEDITAVADTAPEALTLAALLTLLKLGLLPGAPDERKAGGEIWPSNRFDESLSPGTLEVRDETGRVVRKIVNIGLGETGDEVGGKR